MGSNSYVTVILSLCSYEQLLLTIKVSWILLGLSLSLHTLMAEL